DFFEQLFGSAGRSGRFARGGRSVFTEQDTAQRGRNIRGDIMVSLGEAVRGSVRSGSGKRAGPGGNWVRAGMKGQRTCTVCGGAGRVTRAEQFQVRIPAGVTDGQQLRLARRGEAGVAGGETGDLFLRVRLARHPDFQVEEHNLIYEAEI